MDTSALCEKCMNVGKWGPDKIQSQSFFVTEVFRSTATYFDFETAI